MPNDLRDRSPTFCFESPRNKQRASTQYLIIDSEAGMQSAGLALFRNARRPVENFNLVRDIELNNFGVLGEEWGGRRRGLL